MRAGGEMSGCIRDGSKKSVLSWLQEPEKMMDPAQEEPRVLLPLSLLGERDGGRDGKSCKKLSPILIKKERSAERLRGNSMGRCFGEVSREWRDMRHVPIPTS